MRLDGWRMGRLWWMTLVSAAWCAGCAGDGSGQTGSMAADTLRSAVSQGFSDAVTALVQAALLTLAL